MRTRTMTGVFTLLLLLFMLAACSSETSDNTNESTQGATEAVNGTKVEFSDTDLASDWDSGSATAITLSGDSVSIEGNGALAEETTVNITAAGTYILSGTLNDGQIVVAAGSTDKVHLVLNGADIVCSYSAAIYVKNADKTIITLAENTTNMLTDSSSYIFENAADTEPSGCIFSADDLTINGTGGLVVNGNYNNGIDTNNDLKIVSGDITIMAANNGLKGTDSIGIMGGSIVINSKDDGIKADNDTETGQGYFYMEGGLVTVTASDDGIVATTSVLITAGEITVSAGDKDVNCDGTNEIADGCLVSR